MARYVFHIDVNSAYLSWSAVYRIGVLGLWPDLRAIPSVVGGEEKSRHGIVLAKSGPAKKYGIMTGEPLVFARQKCPQLVVIPPDYGLYVGASKALMELLHRYTDEVTQYSIDEAWAVFEGCEGLYGPVVSFALDLKEEIKRELGFTVNIGISTNRLLAKAAGELRKPDRVNTLFPEEIERKLWPLPVEEMFGIGAATAKKLHRLGIFTLGQLAKADSSMLAAHLKKYGQILQRFANGGELEPYIFEQEANKGYGNSMTVPMDVTDDRTAHQVLLSLCETVGMRLREDKVKAGVIGVHVRTFTFENAGRQKQLFSATDVTWEIYRQATELLDQLWDHKTPLRRFGVFTSGIVKDCPRQYNLFDGDRFERLEKLDRAVDQIRKKYGEDAVLRAAFLKAPIRHMNGGLHSGRRTGVTAGIALEKEKSDGF